MNLPRSLANLNGVTMPLEDVKIPALDRGFQFGDAVYEVLRVYRGRPWLLDEHWQRFGHSLEAIRIHGVDLERLKQRMLATIAAGGFQEALVYLHITRGVAPRKHAFPPDAVPTEFLYVQEFLDYHADLRHHGAAVLTQPDLRWKRCDIKSTNLLANVLAVQSAAEAGCIEALLYQPDDTLTEATHSSFFWVREGVLQATPNSPGILPGITRGYLVNMANKVGVRFQGAVLRRGDLPRVSELFLTGTGAEVMPVVRVDGRPIGDGHVGPVTRRLQDAYQAAVRSWLGTGAPHSPGR
jgi:D-alanine transaminase